MGTHYLASILLRADSYEAELNERLLGELRNRPVASEISSPGILPGPVNRAYFIDRFLSELRHLPSSVEIITPEPVFQEQIDGYEDGRPDPVEPGGTWRAMSLDVRLDLGGKRSAKLFLRELPCEQLVMVSFAFEPPSDRDLPRFRDFLLALTDGCPASSGTLGLDLDAAAAGLPHDPFRLDNGMWLHQLTRKIRQAGYGHSFDFIIVNPAASGWDKPFVYDGIEPRKYARDPAAGRGHYDLQVVEEIRVNAERAEHACTRMYESKYPKDDRDDALSLLSKAIGLATDLGLEKEIASLKERHEHINEVFNSQFRR